MRTARLRKGGTALALVSLLTLGLAACGDDSDGKSSNGEETRVFAADNGDITIPVDPERIVATGYAVPILIESGADLVGVSEWSRGLPMMTEEDVATYESLEKVAGETAAETNYEAVAKAAPDLIVIGVPTPALVDLDMERLETIAPVVVLGPTVPDSWRTLSELQADAAGVSEGWQETKDAFEAKAAELTEKYADALDGIDFGHLGAYGDVSAGQFHREFPKSWGTNVATDVGVNYYGEVKKKGGGAEDVSEYPAIEELPESFAAADAITYSLAVDGSVSESVQYVLDSNLWKQLPAVKAGMVFPVQYTEAATYTQALKTLEALDTTLAPLLDK